MQIGSNIQESAFLGEENDYDDYSDHVIKIEIRGDTVDEIDQVAQAAGMTSAQWIRVTIAAELLKSQPEKLIKRAVDDYVDYLSWSRRRIEGSAI